MTLTKYPKDTLFKEIITCSTLWVTIEFLIWNMHFYTKAKSLYEVFMSVHSAFMINLFLF